jgi:hypothetical protein
MRDITTYKFKYWYGQTRSLVARDNLIEQLYTLSGISDKTISSAQEDLLMYLCRYPDNTAYTISKLNALNKTEILSKELDDRIIRRSIEGLDSLKLIERQNEGNSKPCRVTFAGIVYLILKRKVLAFSTITWIFRNYGDNILFKRILYPYISKDTIMRLVFFNSLSPVALFLYDFCREIVSSIESTYIPENADLMKLIIASKTDPQDARQSKALITFLKRRFNLDWLDKANVVLENDTALRISYGSNSILIRLYNSNTKAVLTVSKKRRKRQFVVEVFPDDYIVRNKSVMTREESLEFFLSATVTHLVPTFIFRLASNVAASSEDFRTLCKDKNFMKLLESTRNNFDIQHELFLKEQKTYSSL